MVLRYLHTFGRFAWLLIIPLIIVPLAIWQTSRPSYNANANLWVDQPLYNDSARKPDGSMWDSPSSQVAGLLKQLLATRSFATRVIDGSPLYVKTLKTDTERAVAVDELGKSFVINVNGYQLIALGYTANDPNLATEMLSSLVTSFTAAYSDRITEQARGTITYQQDQVTTAKTALNDAETAMKVFVEKNPSMVTAAQTLHPVSQLEIDFANLTQNQTAARKKYDDATSLLDKANDNYNAFLRGQDTTLKVQDKPALSAAATAGVFRSLLVGGGIGLAAGIIIIIGLVVVLTLLDRTLRQSGHTARVLHVNHVMQISNAGASRRWRRVQRKTPGGNRRGLTLRESFGSYLGSTGTNPQGVVRLTLRKAEAQTVPTSRVDPVIRDMDHDQLQEALNNYARQGVHPTLSAVLEAAQAVAASAPAIRPQPKFAGTSADTKSATDDTFEAVISRIFDNLQEDYSAWQNRTLPARYAYAIADRTFFNVIYNGETVKIPIMAISGISEVGEAEVIAFSAGERETQATWRNLVGSLKERGTNEIGLWVSDGHRAMLNALETHYPNAPRQRCIEHKIENVLSYVPKAERTTITPELVAIFEQPSREEAQQVALEFAATYRPTHPTAVECLERDFEACLTFYDFPEADWATIRTTALIEPLFEEAKKRSHSLAAAFRDEGSCALLFYAVLRSVSLGNTPAPLALEKAMTVA